MRKATGWKAVLKGVFAAIPLLWVPTSASAKAIELNYAVIWPATHATTMLATEWGKEVEKRTNGAVKVTVFAGATLSPPDQTYDAVVKGIADIGTSVVSYAKGRFPLTEVIDLPLGYTSANQATHLANAYYQKFQPKEFSDTKIMYFFAHGPGVFHTLKKPLDSMDDLKGLKIRCTGTSARIVSSLGGTPVAMPQTETYDALQKGVVEGVVSPLETLKGWKFAELVKFTTLNYGSAYSLAFFVTMNKQKWDSIPKDAQAAIEKLNQEWVEKTAKVWDQIDKEGREFGLSKGVKFVTLTPAEDAKWAEKVRPVIHDYETAMKAKGLPGEEAVKFCLDWLKKNK
ncbi:MAG: TRAP transporter substrate-binding protein [Deltaproteobacteria bacterium]|nr:TRAP transporter substrate-binding protein [Deltaproteobacteria bacterium]